MSAPTNLSRERLNELRIDRDAEPTHSPRRARLVVAVLAIVVVGAGLVAVAVHAWSSPTLVQVSTVPVDIDAVTPDAVDPDLVAHAEAVAMDAVLNATGYVTPRVRATISSKVTGKIEEVRVEEGMRVARGDVIAVLDSATTAEQVRFAESQLAAAQAALVEAEVLLSQAQSQVDRTLALQRVQAAPRAQLERERFERDARVARVAIRKEDVAVAESALAIRRQEMEDRIIRAPFSGVVVAKTAQPGETISPSSSGGFTRTGVCTLVDMSSLEIEVDVSEAYINRVRPDQKIQATLDAYPDWKIAGTVITAVPTADRQKATVRVRIGFDGLDPRVLPDMAIRVAFLEADRSAGLSEPRMWVPLEAVHEEGPVARVFVLEAGVLRRRDVVVGRRDAGRIEVKAGLGPRDRVVIEGSQPLTDGAAAIEETA